MPLQREQIALVLLSLAEGAPFTPVQIQKALFLASDKVPEAFELGSHYDFQPYDYGPFDRQVYSDIEILERNDLARINQERWKTYAATPFGMEHAVELANRLTRDQIDMLGRIVDLVRTLSFNDLVSAIYRAYPHMRERSVFRD